ncbi:hypothetical protein L520_3081 [Bordetella bronchiseptica MBORD681]|nr:hypothetical protein L520_3081 [Bordetella bronchiseptica MBORD681]
MRAGGQVGRAFAGCVPARRAGGFRRVCQATIIGLATQGNLIPGGRCNHASVLADGPMPCMAEKKTAGDSPRLSLCVRRAAQSAPVSSGTTWNRSPTRP